jgi:hypothetical protein
MTEIDEVTAAERRKTLWVLAACAAAVLLALAVAAALVCFLEAAP